MMFNRIHAICNYLRQDQCKKCHAWEKSEYGPAMRGCYVMAREVSNIAKYGNPWGKKTTKKNCAAYRKRINNRTNSYYYPDVTDNDLI